MSKKHARELARNGNVNENVGGGSEQKKKDNSPYVHQEDKLKRPLQIECKYPLTEKQKLIIETAMDKTSQMIMIDGYWGTGKSLLAVLAALQLMNQKKVSGIVFIRSPLEASATAKVGTLPGSLEERMECYNAILYDKLSELLPKPDIDLLKKEHRLECYPVGLIQGKTFSAKAVILDEAASCSYDDIMLVASRMGEHGKLLIIGDSSFQLSIGSRSGFKRFYDQFDDQESMENGVFTFPLKEKADIRRSGLLRFIMEKTGALRKT
jgi:phosphate starvation-inducible protein PhoH